MALVWPFNTKTDRQLSPSGVDQGFDIDDTGGGTPVHAIAPGVITHLLDDPSGFGHNYPIEHLDASIGGPTLNVYYGHVTSAVPAGTHVAAGDVIAHTHTGRGDGNGGPGHLEIGFAQDSGQQISAGEAMRRLLVPAEAHGGGATPGATTTTGGGSGTSFDWTDPSSWGPALEEMIANLPGDVLKSLLGGHTLAEIGLRTVEVVGGAGAIAIGTVMVLKLVSSGGQSGRAIRSTRRAGRRVTSRARQARSALPSPDARPTKSRLSGAREVTGEVIDL